MFLLKRFGSGEPCDGIGQHTRPNQWLIDLACEQIHTHLVADIRHRWSEISKVCAPCCEFSRHIHIQTYTKDSQNYFRQLDNE